MAVALHDHVPGRRARREGRLLLVGGRFSDRDQLLPLWHAPGAVKRRLLGRLDLYRRLTNREWRPCEALIRRGAVEAHLARDPGMATSD